MTDTHAGLLRTGQAHVMTLTDTKIHVVTLAAVLLAGCAAAPPPRDQLLAAETALARAERARAADYAPMDLDFARRQFAAADAAASDRDFDRARRLALQAELNAELAAAKSRAAAARAEIQRRTEENAQLRRDLLGDGSAGR